MKRVFSLLAAFLFVGAMALHADEHEKEEKKGPKFEWETPRFDYGTLYLDDMPETKLDIKFTNTGDEPLVLSNVRACCGTRVTSWPREPIMPGQEEVIKIEFRLAPRPQRISRTVTVTYNNPQSPTERFRITGQVVERE
ncbi:MAG: DUF1573 domain-containing protein [Bacteroidia bacterium]|nr:MAG: DUF1573 domain-containing protein [Bacteroidia bacterium]